MLQFKNVTITHRKDLRVILEDFHCVLHMPQNYEELLPARVNAIQYLSETGEKRGADPSAHVFGRAEIYRGRDAASA